MYVRKAAFPGIESKDFLSCQIIIKRIEWQSGAGNENIFNQNWDKIFVFQDLVYSKQRLI